MCGRSSVSLPLAVCGLLLCKTGMLHVCGRAAQLWENSPKETKPHKHLQQFLNPSHDAKQLQQIKTMSWMLDSCKFTPVGRRRAQRTALISSSPYGTCLIGHRHEDRLWHCAISGMLLPKARDASLPGSCFMEIIRQKCSCPITKQTAYPTSMEWLK